VNFTTPPHKLWGGVVTGVVNFTTPPHELWGGVANFTSRTPPHEL
jgi:hypothetical protein